MRSHLKILGLSALLYGSMAAGQESIIAQKSAAGLDLSIKPYSNLDSRYYTVDQAGNAKTASYVQLRPTIGAKLFNEKFDLFVTSRHNRTAGDAKLTLAQYDLYFMLKPYQIGLLALGIYYQQEQLLEDTTYHIGVVNATLNKDFTLSSGILSLTAYAEYDIKLASNDTKSTYKTKDGSDPSLTLSGLAQKNDQNVYQGKRQEPDLYSEFDLTATYKLAAVQGLQLQFINYLMTNYNEVVAVGADGSQNSSYQQSNNTEQLLGVGYKINDAIMVFNESIFDQKGIYQQAQLGANRSKITYTNLTRMTYTLL